MPAVLDHSTLEIGDVLLHLERGFGGKEKSLLVLIINAGTLTLSLLDWVSSQLVSRLRYQFSAPSKPVLFEGRNVNR